MVAKLFSKKINQESEEKSKDDILQLIKKPWFIPETTNLLDQKVALKKKKEHLSLVIDENG